MPAISVCSGRTSSDRLVLALVLACTAALAIFTYRQYLPIARYRWDGCVHDRNAHYLLGLSLALDVRHGDLKQLFSDLDGARTWPPLHGLLEAAALLIGRLDYHWAVLPSLFGWGLAVVCSFLLARRIAPAGGNWAGWAAVAFLVASPAHRAFATDTMLESLGAGLSLLAIYLYLVAAEEAAALRGRALALCLTALFFHKYNYWLLVVLAVAGSELMVRWRVYRDFQIGLLGEVNWKAVWQAQVRNPLNYLLGITVALLGLVNLFPAQAGRWTASWSSGHTSHTLLYLAYIFLFARLAQSWRRSGDDWLRRLDVRYRPLVFAHALPVAIYFLWPKRLLYFLWFLSPANEGEAPERDWAKGLEFYGQCLLRDYHLDFASLCLALGLAAVTLLMFFRLRGENRAIVLYLVLAAVLSISHPNHKSRHLLAWIGSLWVTAGVGFSLLAYNWATERVGRFRPALVTAAVCWLVLAQSPGVLQPGRSPERGHDRLAASTRDLVDYYSPFLDQSRDTLFLSSIEMKHLFRWGYLEKFHRPRGLEVDLKGLTDSPEECRRAFGLWLRKSPCDTIVFVDLRPGSYFDEWTEHNDVYSTQVRQLLEAQTDFVPAGGREFPNYGCAVRLYRRPPAVR